MLFCCCSLLVCHRPLRCHRLELGEKCAERRHRTCNQNQHIYINTFIFFLLFCLYNVFFLTIFVHFLQPSLVLSGLIPSFFLLRSFFHLLSYYQLRAFSLPAKHKNHKLWVGRPQCFFNLCVCVKIWTPFPALRLFCYFAANGKKSDALFIFFFIFSFRSDYNWLITSSLHVTIILRNSHTRIRLTGSFAST